MTGPLRSRGIGKSEFVRDDRLLFVAQFWFDLYRISYREGTEGHFSIAPNGAGTRKFSMLLLSIPLHCFEYQTVFMELPPLLSLLI